MNITRLYHTLCHLKPVQFYGRAWFRLYQPTVDISRSLTCRNVESNWAKPASKVISLVGPKTFSFLNQENELTSPDDWNHKDWEKLWLYNLHYFDDLNGVGAETRKNWHIDLLEKWVAENPVGHGNGWEPYPSSVRIVNWIKWSFVGNQLSPAVMQSLEVQVRYLRKRLEIHLLGNHLLANAKALVFAGLFFQGREADEWLRKGLKILNGELPEQVLADGGHFERSSMYHAIILEDLLDLINILRAYGQTISQAWHATAEKMLFWLCGMTHPDGEIALLNDAAFGIASRPDQLFAYAERLGLNCAWNDRPENSLIHFEQTGYLRWQDGNAVALLDASKIGPDYLPGHAHADTLNFELSVFRQRLFVDSGTSCYGANQERLLQRGTAAHNTVMIDDQNSSEVWSGFRVARRARPFGLKIEAEKGTTTVRCAHDGFWRLKGRPTHWREWVFDQKQITIKDLIENNFTKAIGRFHLHPDVEVTSEDIAPKGTIVLKSGQQIRWQVLGGDVRIAESTYHPEFGLSVPNKCIEVVFTDRESRAIFSWD